MQDNFDAVYEVSKRDSVKMESEHYPRHHSEPALYKTQALSKGSTNVSKKLPELSTKLKPRNNKLECNMDGVTLYSKRTMSNGHESDDRKDVGLGMFTQRTRSEDGFDEFIVKPKANAFVWDKVYTRDRVPQDCADKHIKEYDEVNSAVHDTGLDKPGKSTADVLADGGGTQDLAHCGDDIVEGEDTHQGCTLTDRLETSTEKGILVWPGEEQDLSGKRSRGNVSEETLTAGDNMEIEGPAILPATAAVYANEELEKESAIGGYDEYDLVKPNEEARMVDEKNSLRESNSEKERDPLLEALAQIENMRNSQTVVASNHLGNMKFAVANLMSEVMNSYEAACGIKVDRTLMLLTKPALHFLETQEIKKTFHLKEITSAMAELAEDLPAEDFPEFRKLRETAQTLYDLQTREVYFDQNTSESGTEADAQVGNSKTVVCFYSVVVAAGIALGLNGEWMALLLLVLMILFCVVLAWRGARSVESGKKRTLRAKMM